METWLTVFTGVVAFALLLQTLAFFGLYRSVRNLSARIDAISKDVMRNVDALTSDVSQALATIKSVAEGIQALKDKLSSTSDMIYKRVTEVDSFLQQLTDSARLEVARIQDAIDTASRQIEDTFELLHRSVIVPIREVTAIARGVKVGLDFFLRRPKSPSGTSNLDEEMFIG
jgi:uncharacterized protein YoxC